jgi:hypothetical protein
MASQVVEVSRNVRQWVIDYALQDGQSTITRKAETEASYRIQVDSIREREIMDSMLKSMQNYIARIGSPVNASGLANACASKYRNIIPAHDAITEGLRRGIFIPTNDNRYRLPN